MRAIGQLSLVRQLWKNRTLLHQLVQRDFSLRFVGGYLGPLWALFNPLLLLSLYSFVFVGVFHMRWGTGPNVSGNFVVLLFSGLLVHGILAECLTRAPTLITSNPSYVKKIVFPLAMLPPVLVIVALINFSVGFVLLILLQYLSDGQSFIGVLLTPVIIAPFALMVLGISFFLCALGVYIRDITQVTGLIATVTMFGSPVLYPLELVPEKYRIVLFLNPITFVVEQLRDTALLGKPFDWQGLCVYAACSLITLTAGYTLFQATRKGFADVL
jgi:lipopolysaccharide transport system permease protein